MNKVHKESLDVIVKHICDSLDASEFIEIRAIDPAKKIKPLHGAFRSPNKIIEVANHYNGKLNLYFGLNPRKLNALKNGEAVDSGLSYGSAYGTGAISKINHFLIDIDRKNKPKDQSGNILAATEAELKEINKTALEISAYLELHGIKHSLFLSGNGYHILIHTKDYDIIETPDKFKRILETLHEMFISTNAEIDISTYDAPRICKLYGTMSLKSDKNHGNNRVSAYLSGELYPADILTEFKDHFKYKMKNEKSNIAKQTSTHAWDLTAIFKKHELYVKEIDKNKHIVNCPFRDQHSSDSDETSTTVIFDGDKFGFKCFHNSCREYGTSDVLKKLGEKKTKEQLELSKTPLKLSSGFDFVSLGQVLKMEDEKQEWLVDDVLIQGGTSIMVGRPKSGKTTLARNLSFCVSHGVDWLNIKTQKSTVLFVALEDKMSQLKKLYIEMKVDPDAPLFFHVSRTPQNPIENLKEEIIKREAGLVIIDTMLRFHTLEDVNNYTQTNNFFIQINELARTTNCHILVLHHQGKGSEGTIESDDERSVLGSTAIGAGVDTILMITLNNGQRYISSRQRYGTDLKKSALIFNEGNQIEMVDKQHYQQNSAKEKILKLLENGPLSRSKLSQSAGINGQTFTNKLKELIDETLVKKTMLGREHIYELDTDFSALLGDEEKK